MADVSPIPDLEVRAIPLGWMTIERSTMVLGSGYRESIRVPLWCAAILGGVKKIVVDTGVHDPSWVCDHIGPCEQAPEERLDRALKSYLGWSLADVEVVINTHLHFDHCGGNFLFPNAMFYAQAAEWAYAESPLSIQAPFYKDFLLRKERRDMFRWILIQGDCDIIPGVRLFPTPGHTPGHQSIAVNTREGVVVIAGDCVNCMENLQDNKPVGVLHDAEAELRSLRWIRGMADFVIPGHDPDVAPGSAGLKLPR